MIKEIYIDNYRCLVNFRIRPGEFQLWLGDAKRQGIAQAVPSHPSPRTQGTS